MSRALVRAFCTIMVLGGVVSIAVTSVHATFTRSSCPTGFANFGDSLTDTGNFLDAFPFAPDAPFVENAEDPPYGETFFGAPAKRFSNGRLVPDFFSQAFGFPLLDAYFSVDSFNFKHGINFANAGSNAAFSTSAISPFSVTPFQTSQFIRFQNDVNSTEAQLGCGNFNVELPSLFENPFTNWLYTITAGSNDLLTPLIRGVSTDVINNTIVPQAVNATAIAIETLYQRGARRFLVSGISNGGCSPVILTLLQNQNFPKDNNGCIVFVNNVIQNFNTQLLSAIKGLRQVLTGVSIAYFDYFSANTAILSDPTAFGFNPSLTTTACCGAPGAGPYNYNPFVRCGKPSLGSNNCANPDQYISWDGEHFTEAFYRNIATFALNGQYTDGGVNYTSSCYLDFSKFGSNITFQQAYPFQFCNNFFT